MRERVLFPLEFKAEIHTAPTIFTSQRMEKWELSSQIKFSPMWGEQFNFKVDKLDLCKHKGWGKM